MGDLDERTDIQAHSDNLIAIDGKRIALTSERDLKQLNWATLGVDYVLECTGKFTKRELAMDHVNYGQAKRVLISAPSSDSPTFVYGVNSDSYTPTEDCRVVSNASCTTNCVTPVLKVLDETFGVTQGFLTTIHAATRSQQVLDGYSKKNRRLGKKQLRSNLLKQFLMYFSLGRGVFNNIIPTSTGAAKAVAAVLPGLKGKVTGVSIRVPTYVHLFYLNIQLKDNHLTRSFSPNVSMIDLTISTAKPTSLQEIISAFRLASKSNMAGVLRVTDEELVSQDYNGSPYSAIIDAPACTELNPQFFKIMAWYDNEWGYSNRLLDLTTHVHALEA